MGKYCRKTCYAEHYQEQEEEVEKEEEEEEEVGGGGERLILQWRRMSPIMKDRGLEGGD
jgi:hypothetical protein